jgi:hypothetical protein
LLAAATSLLAWDISHATSHTFYLNISISNATGKELAFCLKGRAYCETVKPGNALSTGGHDTNESEKTLENWVAGWQLEVCGKKLSLGTLQAMHAFNKVADGKYLTYDTKITDQDIAPLCGGSTE